MTRAIWVKRDAFSVAYLAHREIIEIIECEPRLGNTSFAAGNAEVSGAPAYCVYVAFKFEADENTTGDTFNMQELNAELHAVLDEMLEETQ